MVMDFRPEQALEQVVQQGIAAFKNTIQGVTEVLRVGDTAIKDLDNAMRGKPIAPGETSEETFLNVLAMIRAAMEEARETGSAAAPVVVQRAREILNRVTTVEPAWRVGPSVVKTASDMFRMALRDLRGSDALIKLATGRGELDDMEKLIDWAESVTGRLDKAQRVVAEPKPAAAEKPPVRPQAAKQTPKRAAGGAKTRAAKMAEKKVRDVSGDPDLQLAAEKVAMGKMAEKKVRDTVFGAIGEVSGDPDLQLAAEKVAMGKMNPDEFADGVTSRLENGKLNHSIMNKAREKAIQDGVDANHPLLQF